MRPPGIATAAAASAAMGRLSGAGADSRFRGHRPGDGKRCGSGLEERWVQQVGGDPDVTRIDTLGAGEPDLRAGKQSIAPGACALMERIRQFVLEGVLVGLERSEVPGVERDAVAVRDVGAIGAEDTSRVHRPLQPSLKLDRLQRGPEQPRSRSLKEPFEEPLERGEWPGHRAAESSRGPAHGRPGASWLCPRALTVALRTGVISSARSRAVRGRTGPFARLPPYPFGTVTTAPRHIVSSEPSSLKEACLPHARPEHRIVL